MQITLRNNIRKEDSVGAGRMEAPLPFMYGIVP